MRRRRRHADAFAEATLAAHFGALVAFARDAEATGSGWIWRPRRR